MSEEFRVEKLRILAERLPKNAAGYNYNNMTDLASWQLYVTEHAMTICTQLAAQTAELEALRRALEPFAQFAAELDEESEQLRNSYVVLRAPPGKALTLGQFRAASAALALWSMRAPAAPAGEGK